MQISTKDGHRVFSIPLHVAIFRTLDLPIFFSHEASSSQAYEITAIKINGEKFRQE